MIGGNVVEFVDGLMFGDELWFKFRGKRYFMQGWHVEDTGMERLELRLDEGSGEVLWAEEQKLMSMCASYFLHQPIWDGKTFCEAEAEMEWVD